SRAPGDALPTALGRRREGFPRRVPTRSETPESVEFPPQWALAFALAPQANPPTWEYAVAGAAVVALAAWLLNSRARVRTLQREGERTRAESARMQAELERS